MTVLRSCDSCNALLVLPTTFLWLGRRQFEAIAFRHRRTTRVYHPAAFPMRTTFEAIAEFDGPFVLYAERLRRQALTCDMRCTNRPPAEYGVLTPPARNSGHDDTSGIVLDKKHSVVLPVFRNAGHGT